MLKYIDTKILLGLNFLNIGIIYIYNAMEFRLRLLGFMEFFVNCQMIVVL